MSAGLLLLGVVLGLLAVLVLVFLVIAPPPPRVAASRRRAPGVEHVSLLNRASARTTAVVDSATSGRARFFGPEQLELAGIAATPSQFVIYVAAAASGAALLGVLLGLANGTAVLLAVLFAVATPLVAKMIVILKTGRRRTRFADQIDDTVQLMAGGLRAGHGLSRTIAAVASEAPAPMGEELARVMNETRLGRDLPGSLSTTAARMRSDDFEWVAQAVAINAETGGNLAEVLDRVGSTIRERNQIRRQVKALSAEGRLSGIILIALPIGMFILLSVIQPTFLPAFFGTFIGIFAFIVGVILLILGTIWIAAVVRVKF